MYEKVLTLSELVGSTAQRPRICSRQRNRDNTSNRFGGTVLEANSGNTSVLSIIFSELKSRFNKEKQAHYELCVLIPVHEIVTKSIEAIGCNW